MQNHRIKKMFVYIFLLAFFTVLGVNYLKERGQYHTLQQKTVEDPEFRILCAKIGSYYQMSVKLSSKMWKRM